MGYNPHKHVCEWFYFNSMCINDRNEYLWKRFLQLPVVIKFTSKPYINSDTLLRFV
jgi:hypothetical protein